MRLSWMFQLQHLPNQNSLDAVSPGKRGVTTMLLTKYIPQHRDVLVIRDVLVMFNA